MDDLKPSQFHMHRLYFKGLVSEETTRFGVAICGREDNLLFHNKGSRHHDSAITVLEAELTALKRGLTEALGLGINHISFYCDHDHIFELVLGISKPEQDNIAILLDDVKCIRQQMTSSIPVLMTRNQAKFAYKLTMETVVSEISIRNMPPLQKKTCCICYNDFEAEHMFSVALCGHDEFCVECMKRHIEVRLLEGSVPRCPHYQCKSNLTLTSCANLLMPKLREMWERMNKEEQVPVADRVYCPNPRCSALMSKMGDETIRCCFECGEPFCVNCKVAWHSNLSCDDYKRLGPNPTEDDIKLKALANQNMWRQCGNCNHMIEFSHGCIRITCRCGYKFCYICGAQWKKGGCPHRERIVAEYDLYDRIFLGAASIYVVVFVSFYFYTQQYKR